MQIANIDSIDEALHALNHLLIETVDDGASIGFLPPLAIPEATAYWQDVGQEIAVGEIEMFGAFDGERLLGSVQLALPAKPNASHRCEVQKLMVLPQARSQGIGRQLMAQLEDRAATLGRTLIVLDTRAGDVASQLYLSMGYVSSGRVPRYARSANGELHATVFFHKELNGN